MGRARRPSAGHAPAPWASARQRAVSVWRPTASKPPARRRADGGASAIELAVVTPALLLLIFFTVQLALWLYGRNVALQAAREGVSQLRLVSADSDVNEARRGVERSVERYAATIGRESLAGPVAGSAYDDPPGRVVVTVSGRVISLVPGLTLTVSQRADGEIERFEADE